LVKVRWNYQHTGSSEVRCYVDDIRIESSRIGSIAIIKLIACSAENMAILVCVVRIGCYDAVKEIISSDFFEQRLDEKVYLGAGNKCHRRTVRL
jgi:hypothetical protein